MDKSSKTPFLIRSLIIYDASKDHSLPAKGYSLQFGEIVAVIDCFDDNWWKVCKYNYDSDSRRVSILRNQCGLIPSLKRHNKKIIKKYHRNIEWNVELTEELDFTEDAPPPIPLANSKYQNSLKNITQITEDRSLLRSSVAYRSLDLPSSKSNLSQLNNSNNSSVIDSPQKNYGSSSSVNSDSSLLNRNAYQYVKIVDNPKQIKPLVILGFLRYRIYEALKTIDPYVYDSVVAHTTRPIRSNEEEGKDYYYTTQRYFDQETSSNRKGFLQWGKFRDNLYGTHVSAVTTLIRENKCALLDVTGEAIPNLHRHNIFPHVILIKISSHKWIQNDDNTKAESHARELINKNKRLEDMFIAQCTKVVEVGPEQDFDDIVEGILRHVSDEHPNDTWQTCKQPITV